MPNSSNQIEYAPPKHDEIEISLFGPGVGECIVAHIGNNEWIIIDSCVDWKTKIPIPLIYLEKLGIDPSQAVKLFIISHWHSDHIRGASKIATQCKAANICLSAALLKEEFLTLVDFFSGLKNRVIVDQETCATKEMASIIMTIKKRCENKPIVTTPYTLISDNKRIYRSSIQGKTNELWTLSPSSESIRQSLQEIANLMPSSDDVAIRKVIPKPKTNNNSIVLQFLHSNNYSILLGADLEETTNALTGWSCIVNSPNRPFNKSCIFKIPHHGSINGHFEGVWDKMLEKDAVSILTPKIGGQSSIPKNSDIRRLKSYTPNLYTTSEPLSKKQKRSPTIEKTISGIVKKRVPLNGEFGQIQIRIDNISQTRINLKSPAKSL